MMSETINDAFRFELDLNDAGRDWCARSAGVARYTWNWGLAERKKRFEQNQGKDRFISGYNQINEWAKQKPTWAYEVSCWASISALQDLETAFRNFWRGRKAGRKMGFPRFKAYGKTRDSFKLRRDIRIIDENHIKLPGAKSLKIKGSAARMAAIGYDKILSATVSRTADRWFVSILVERGHVIPTQTATEAVGIDLGLKTSLVLSTGEEIQGPRPLRAALRRLAHAQRALARSQRNSNARKKKALVVAKVHMRVANIRCDWQHKTSDRLTREFGTIGLEQLAIKNLTNKKRHAGLSWADLGAAELMRQIKYKAERRGVTVVIADRFYPSSQLCSGCGHRQPMPLKERIYRCGSCTLVLDRDLNAAKNLCPVAVTPTETQNAGGGNVSPDTTGSSNATGTIWQIPMKPEPGMTRWVRPGAPISPRVS